MLSINLEYRKGILFIRLKGNLTKNTCSNFQSYVFPIIENNGIRYIVYNLEGINMIDEEGKNVIQRGCDYVNNNDGKVLIINEKMKNFFNLDFIKNELVAFYKIKV